MKRPVYLLIFVLILVACGPNTASQTQFVTDFPIEILNTPTSVPTPNATPTANCLPGQPLSDSSCWFTITEVPGITIKRESSTRINYLFIIDPAIVTVTVRKVSNEAIPMSQLLMERDPEADCGFAGPLYFNKDASSKTAIQAFPIIENGQKTPGENLNISAIRTLYVDHGRVWMSDTPSNDALQSAEYAISGMSIVDFQDLRDNIADLYYEIAAVKDGQILILTTKGYAIKDLIKLLTDYGVSSSNIMIIDWNIQAGCFAKDYWQWNNPVGSALFVTQ